MHGYTITMYKRTFHPYSAIIILNHIIIIYCFQIPSFFHHRFFNNNNYHYQFHPKLIPSKTFLFSSFKNKIYNDSNYDNYKGYGKDLSSSHNQILHHSQQLQQQYQQSVSQKKRTLLIFGSGNVAKSVTKYALQRNKNNSSSSHELNDEICGDFQLVVRTYLPSYDDIEYNSYMQYENKSQSNHSTVVPQIFNSNDDDDDDIQYYQPKQIFIPYNDTLKIMDAIQSSTHILITIPPQKRVMTNDTSDCESYYDPIIESNLHHSIVESLNCHNELFHDKNNTNDYNDTHTNEESNESEPLYSSLPIYPKWIGFISTTGVYGNHNNEWVTEESETKCTSTKLKMYLEMEQFWMNLSQYHASSLVSEQTTTISPLMMKNNVSQQQLFNVFIFRCAALYGDNISALHTMRKIGMPYRTSTSANSMTDENTSTVVKEYTSRIHLDDVGRAVVSSMIHDYHPTLNRIPDGRSKNSFLDNNDNDIHNQGNPNNNIFIYNLADDFPESRAKVMEYACTLLKKNDALLLPSMQSDLSGGVQSDRSKRRNIDRKRICNHKLKCDLLNKYGGLKYPSYKEGLQSILDTNKIDWTNS